MTTSGLINEIVIAIIINNRINEKLKLIYLYTLKRDMTKLDVKNINILAVTSSV